MPVEVTLDMKTGPEIGSLMGSFLLSVSAREYLNLKDYQSMRKYHAESKGKQHENDFSSVDTYLNYCDLKDLPLYINHPSTRIRYIIEKRLREG